MKNAEIKNFIRLILEEILEESDDFLQTKKLTGSQPNQRRGFRKPFSLAELEKKQTLFDIKNYIFSSDAKKISEGRGRFVFKVNDGILKLANDDGGEVESGSAQNGSEAKQCGDDPSMFPKIIKQGPNNLWILVEEAKTPITAGEFEAFTGISWAIFVSALKGMYENSGQVSNVTDADRKNFIFASHNMFFNKIIRTLRKCKYIPGDLTKLDSWGIIGGPPSGLPQRLVIIDPGTTEEIFQKYYSGD